MLGGGNRGPLVTRWKHGGEEALPLRITIGGRWQSRLRALLRLDRSTRTPPARFHRAGSRWHEQQHTSPPRRDTTHPIQRSSTRGHRHTRTGSEHRGKVLRPDRSSPPYHMIEQKRWGWDESEYDRLQTVETSRPQEERGEPAALSSRFSAAAAAARGPTSLGIGCGLPKALTARTAAFPVHYLLRRPLSAPPWAPVCG